MTNEFIQIESYVSGHEKAWLKWLNDVEKILGHSLDGDGPINGYSLDEAYEAWEGGFKPSEYADRVNNVPNYCACLLNRKEFLNKY